jgi:hypothetical protein
MRSFVATLLRMTATAKATANGPAKAGRYRRKYLLVDDASPGKFLNVKAGRIG